MVALLLLNIKCVINAMQVMVKNKQLVLILLVKHVVAIVQRVLIVILMDLQIVIHANKDLVLQVLSNAQLVDLDVQHVIIQPLVQVFAKHAYLPLLGIIMAIN